MDEVNFTQEERKILAILFALGTVNKTALQKFDINLSNVDIQKIRQKIQKIGLPFVIVESADNLDIGLDKEMSEFIKKILKKEKDEELTDNAAQVLSLVLYCAPISKSEIDYIRGVNSATVLRKLIMRGLVTRKKEGASIYYYPSTEFLASLGISSTDELEDKDDFCQKLRDMLNLNK